MGLKGFKNLYLPQNDTNCTNEIYSSSRKKQAVTQHQQRKWLSEYGDTKTIFFKVFIVQKVVKQNYIHLVML